MIQNYDYEVQTSHTLHLLLFSRCYVYIVLLIWSKSWNYVYWLVLLFLIAQTRYADVENSLYQPLSFYWFKIVIYLKQQYRNKSQ